MNEPKDSQPVPIKSCPSCGSENPKHHPATSAGGEVSLCHNKWHSPTADEIRAKERLDSQPVPVEPLIVKCMRDPTWCGTEPTQILSYIDTLQSELRQRTEERKSFDAELCKIESVVCMLPEFDGDKAGDCGDRLANAITRLKQSREAAESLNKRMVELLREIYESLSAPFPPYESGKEAQDAWAQRKLNAISKCAELLKEVK